MKPKEFDDLVKNKFEQSDFEYNPRNWDRLTEQMDGRSKKRSLIAWLGLPIAGMAASVALAMGVTTLLRQGMPETNASSKEYRMVAMTAAPAVPQVLPAEPATTTNPTSAQKLTQRTSKPIAAHNTNSKKDNRTAGDNIGGFHIKLSDKSFVQAAPADNYKTPSDNSSVPQNKTTQQNKKKIVLVNEGYNTFKDEPAIKRPANLSIILSGGVNRGNKNTGYMAGATIRHMINERVYVEGDVAFTSSSNTQMTTYAEPVAMVAKTSTRESAAKVTGGELAAEPTPYVPPTVIKQKEISYNLYYAQVSPSIGYKIMSRLSVGAGPDFQKALADNRPAPSSVERGNIQVAPLFDIGFIGKTEYNITKQVKAAVYYRKGINNVITPMDKYIDRDYLQFQVKCTIFNK
jgi:hypothetical protein